MNFLSRLFRRQKKHHKTEEHFRVVSPAPDLNYFPLTPDGSNEGAYDAIHSGQVRLKHVASGEEVKLEDLSTSLVLFATVWEPYSAQSIGVLKRRIDAGELEKVSIVFFENSHQEIVETKTDSWYFAASYVLAEGSIHICKSIHRVPFVVTIGEGAKIENVSEGVIL